MKKFILITLCAISLLNSMERPARKPCEWNAQDYAKGNRFQEKTSLEFLEQQKIDLSDKDIADAGCGTGNISAIMAQKAKSVHGFDASLNMIDYARERYGHLQNLTFEHCFAEDFTSSTKYDLVTAFFCLHWFENRETAFQKFYESLKPNGEFLGAICTTSNKSPTELELFHEMLPWLKSFIDWLKSVNIIQALGHSKATDENLSDMLKNTGFTILSFEKTPLNFTFKNRDEVIALQRPQIMSRPFVQYIPETLREYLFDYFINLYMEKLEKTDEGYRFAEETTVIHCRK